MLLIDEEQDRYEPKADNYYLTNSNEFLCFSNVEIYIFRQYYSLGYSKLLGNIEITCVIINIQKVHYFLSQYY